MPLGVPLVHLMEAPYMDTHIDFMRGPLLHLLYAGALTINADKSTH